MLRRRKTMQHAANAQRLTANDGNRTCCESARQSRKAIGAWHVYEMHEAARIIDAVYLVLDAHLGDAALDVGGAALAEEGGRLLVHQRRLAGRRIADDGDRKREVEWLMLLEHGHD